MNVHKYKVLGGLHSFEAKSELMKEYPDNPFFSKALAEVYLELSDEQALRLAQRHSANSHFIHKITQDYTKGNPVYKVGVNPVYWYVLLTHMYVAIVKLVLFTV